MRQVAYCPPPNCYIIRANMLRANVPGVREWRSYDPISKLVEKLPMAETVNFFPLSRPDGRFVASRRELLKLIAGGVLASRRFVWQERGPEFAGLDHFEFYVSSAEKARDFYVRLFGHELLSRNNKRYLRLGSTYMAFETPRAGASAGQVDHVSLSIRSLDMMKLHALLEQRGVMYQDYPSGRDTAVQDPDGTRLQLSPENGWSLLNPATFKPEAIAFTQDSIFRAIALDHVVF